MNKIFTIVCLIVFLIFFLVKCFQPDQNIIGIKMTWLVVFSPLAIHYIASMVKSVL